MQLAEADLASQARNTAGTLGQTITSSASNAGTAFNRFVEGDSGASNTRGAAEPERKDFWESFGEAPTGPAKDKQDFWDEFSSAGETRMNATQAKKPSGIGTSAMKKTSGGGGAKKDDGWGEW